MSLHLPTADVRPVKLHPVVLFSILDQYSRRNRDQTVVIGALLGRETETHIEVTNCFPVTLMVSEGREVAVGVDWLQDMLALHRQVSTSDDVIGWYTTAEGIHITSETCLINRNVFAEECERPLLLVVDTSLKTAAISVAAYVSTPLSFVERDIAAQFQQTPVALVMSDEERVGIDAMASSKALSTSWDGTSALTSDLDTLERMLAELHTDLQKASEHVDAVLDGKAPADPDVGHNIASALASVPRLDSGMFAKMFSSSLQDLLMVVYLSNLTRAQLAIAERINQTPLKTT